MKAFSVTFKNFRNLNTSLSLNEGVNLLIGKNGEGKTNIAEALWLNCAGKSFKNATDKEMIRFGESEAEINLDYETAGRRHHLRTVLHSDKTREIYLNGLKIKKISDAVGFFSSVLFTPSTLGIIEDGPSERRRFVDIAISQLKPAYMRSLMTYNNALAQRNAFLKLFKNKEVTEYQLLAWECMMAPDGARVIGERKKYLERIDEIASAEFQKITKGKETLSVRYISGNGQFEKEVSETALKLKKWNRLEPYGAIDRMELFEIENALLHKIYDNRKKDLKEGSSSIGPHRDDIEILINGKSARDYASQGQKRSAVLAIKAAECKIIEEETGEPPVVILDDVLSELDAVRRKYVLENITTGQTVITSCETARHGKAAKGKVFEIKEGVATEITK